MARRRFLAVCGAACATVPFGFGAEAAEHPLASFDREMTEFMRARGVPGGALAVMRNRRLIYAQGYGLADRDQKLPVQPRSLFRLASVSKPITAVAVLRLVDQGKLNLTDRICDLLPLAPLPGEKRAAQWEKITVQHLLQHTAGWDRDKSGDPMFMTDRIAKAAGVARPPGPKAIMRYMLGQPLDTEPGTHHAYSNFGYCVLGRILERLSGLSYEACIQKEVLQPAGITTMRLGRSLENQAAPGEVRYYTSGDRKGRSVFDGVADEVPVPYGTFNLEAMDAHGGWVASAVDLMRLVAALEPKSPKPLLSPAMFQTMTTPPAAPVAREKDGSVSAAFYGCGWMVRPTGNGQANLWHSGSLPGTNTLLVRLGNGMTWAALFNQRQDSQKVPPDSAIDGALHRAAAAVRQWPETDLFGKPND